MLHAAAVASKLNDLHDCYPASAASSKAPKQGKRRQEPLVFSTTVRRLVSSSSVACRSFVARPLLITHTHTWRALLHRTHRSGGSAARNSRFCAALPPAAGPQVQKMVLLSQLAVFKDILPGYRIRQITDEEKAQKTTADVRKLRECVSMLHPPSGRGEGPCPQGHARPLAEG